MNQDLSEAFSTLSRPLIADACLRLKIATHLAPPGIRPVTPGSRIAGPVLPVQHYGSIDVFLEAMGGASQGDVLVIDNQGRTDEGCVGDLTILEAQASGLSGCIVWGLHRDTAELLHIDFPVFSYGSCPMGPQRLDPAGVDALELARLGASSVSKEEMVFADADGVLFAPLKRAEEIIRIAMTIRETERAQAEAIRTGKKLKEQLKFDDYLRARARNPALIFREHLRAVGGAIEE